MKRPGGALVGEVVGTFALVFAGTGAIVADAAHGGAVSHLGIALTFGFVVMAMIYALGDVSGAHLNPAVTLAFVAAVTDISSGQTIIRLSGPQARVRSSARIEPAPTLARPSGAWTVAYFRKISARVPSGRRPVTVRTPSGHHPVAV